MFWPTIHTHIVPRWKNCKTQGFINYPHLPNIRVIPQQCHTYSSLPPLISFEQHWGDWNAQVLRKWAGESRGLHHANRWCHVTHQWQIMLFPCMQRHFYSCTFSVWLLWSYHTDRTWNPGSEVSFQVNRPHPLYQIISYFSISSDMEVNKTWPRWDITVLSPV